MAANCIFWKSLNAWTWSLNQDYCLDLTRVCWYGLQNIGASSFLIQRVSCMENWMFVKLVLKEEQDRKCENVAAK